MAEIIIYTKDYCGYCNRAKGLLKIKQVNYKEIDITHDEKKVQEMQELSKRASVPQIFINGKHIGGCDDLFALDKTGELDKLLGR